MKDLEIKIKIIAKNDRKPIKPNSTKSRGYNNRIVNSLG